LQPYKKAFNGDHNAGTNKLEDVDIYAFDTPAPADEGTLNNVVVNSTDEVLKSLLRADIAHDRWIAGRENHKENLPEDPSQASLAASLVSHVHCSALQCCAACLSRCESVIASTQAYNAGVKQSGCGSGCDSGCAFDLTRHTKLKLNVQKATGMTNKQGRDAF